MTFKEYLIAIQLKNDILCIKEHCNGRLIDTHLVFGFKEDDGEDTTFKKGGVVIETKDDYVLYGADGYGTPTYIDTAQQIELKSEDSGVYVVDQYGNKLRLIFFTSSIIPHPAQ